jgi:hypothetical protein
MGEDGTTEVVPFPKSTLMILVERLVAFAKIHTSSKGRLDGQPDVNTLCNLRFRYAGQRF